MQERYSPLRLFVTKGKGVTAQTTAGNPKRHTPRRKASPRARTTNARTRAHKQGPKQPATTRNTKYALRRREQSTHTTSNSPKCNQSKSMRPLPVTRDRGSKSTAPTHFLSPGIEEARALRPQLQQRRRANPLAPEMLPGPRLPLPILAAHKQHNNANDTARKSQ